MATIYCDSAGSNTSPYDTWAKAATTLQTALTAWTSGNVILVKYNSDVGGTTASLTLTGGTIAGRIPIYTANASDVYTKATETNPNIDLTGTNANLSLDMAGTWKGLAFSVNKQFFIDITGISNTLEDLSLEFQKAGTCEIRIGNSAGTSNITIINPTITEVLSSDLLVNMYGSFKIIGGSISVNANSAGLFRVNVQREFNVILDSVDLSGSTLTGPLFDLSPNSTVQFHAKLIKCDLPSGLTLTDGGFGNDNQFVELISTGTSGTDVYNVEKHGYRAVLTTSSGSTATWLTGGYTANNGSGTATNFSHEITPNSVFKDGARFEGPWLRGPNTTTGTSQTVTIYSADDFTTAPNKNQAYIEVVTMSTTGEVLGTLATSRPTDLLATTAMASDSSDWNDTAAGAPSHKHKMEVSFTAQVEGLIAVRVVLEGQDLSGDTANSFFYDPKVNVAAT